MTNWRYYPIIHDNRDLTHAIGIMLDYLSSSRMANNRMMEAENEISDNVGDRESNINLNQEPILKLIDQCFKAIHTKEKVPPAELVSQTKGYRKHIVMSWSEDQMYVTWKHIRQLIPLLGDLLEILEEERDSRRRNEKLFSR